MKREGLEKPVSVEVKTPSAAELKKQNKLEELRAKVGDLVERVLAAARDEEAGSTRPLHIERLRESICDEAENSGIIRRRAPAEKELAEFDRQRFFWGLAGDAVKKIVFPAIYNEIFPLIEKRDYDGARDVVNNRIRETIHEFDSPTHKSRDELSVALGVMREKFYEQFPEVQALVYGAEEGKKQMGRGKPGVRNAKDQPGYPAEYPGSGKTSTGGRPEGGHPRYVKEKTWAVPPLGELKRGLVIEVKNMYNGDEQSIELLEEAYKDKDGTLFVYAKTMTKGASSYFSRALADIGIVPYKNGEWNGWWRPVGWYMKKEQKQK